MKRMLILPYTPFNIQNFQANNAHFAFLGFLWENFQFFFMVALFFNNSVAGKYYFIASYLFINLPFWKYGNIREKWPFLMVLFLAMVAKGSFSSHAFPYKFLLDVSTILQLLQVATKIFKISKKWRSIEMSCLSKVKTNHLFMYVFL